MSKFSTQILIFTKPNALVSPTEALFTAAILHYKTLQHKFHDNIPRD